MRKKKYIFPILLVGAALALAARMFDRPASAEAASNDTSYQAIDVYIEEQLSRLNISGASWAIVEGDEIVHLSNYGQAYPDGDAPTPQTPFMIGSLTKSFTALGVMQLVEAGKIDLDAPVQRYLPWFRAADAEASAQITVRHLLNQTSGLSIASGWIPLADFDASPDATGRQARALSESSLNHLPGSAFEYTNANYNLLGLIIETASGQTYADYIKNHIFKPLEMTHSYTSPTEAKADGLATGHQMWFWNPVAAPDLPVPYGSLPSGQLISTSEDVARYMIAILNEGRYADEQIISDDGLAELHRGVAEHVTMGISVGKYAMGWYIDEVGGTKVAWHTGLVPDFSSGIALLPEQKKGVVLLLNAGHFMMEPIQSEMTVGLATLLAGQQPAPLQMAFLPWVMRGLLLIPLMQVIGVGATLRSLRRWRQNPLTRPTGLRKWGLNVTLPLVLNGLVILLLIPLLGRTRGFVRLFLPDYSVIAAVSGGFAGVWGLARTWLVLRTLHNWD